MLVTTSKCKEELNQGKTYHLSIVLAHSRVLLLGAKLAEVAHDAEITCLSFLLCREVQLICKRKGYCRSILPGVYETEKFVDRR